LESKVYFGDCLEIMKKLEADSIDSIVTDPPYELGFMGKAWDSTGIAYSIELWKEALRVLKPGGHLLAFGGTRTYHRMVCAIEKAGFEIRDQLQWIYGSGFPKSMNVSKAIDKQAGKQRLLNDLQTSEAIQWNGWGTALKPANEPIVLARKTLTEKTIAANVLRWGTGGLNIDDCRVGKDIICAHGGGVNKLGRKYGGGNGIPLIAKGSNEHAGRFPANVILDETAGEILDEQTGTLKSGDNCTRTKPGSFLEHGGVGKAGDVQMTYGDQGGASRFFYCAKASKKERGAGNIHPTVKPIKLMRYLVRLVTPPNGIALDPFAGTGTTGLACIKENKKYILIENGQKSYDIILNRIGTAKLQYNLFEGENIG